MDAAAATPMRPEVVRSIQEVAELFGNPGALHAEGVKARARLEEARREAAEAIGAHADEIVFTGSGTESNNLAIFGVVGTPFSHSQGCENVHIITTTIEHPSVLEPIRALEGCGARVTYLSVDGEGRISLPDVKAALTDETRLVTIGMINSEIGTIQDIRGIAKIIRDRKKEGMPVPLFHVDAAQAPLWLKLNVEQLHPDLLTLDAQKMHGPKGAGLLYVRRGVTLRPHTLGGGQERGLRSGTESVSLAVGLARALSLAQKECEVNTTRVSMVRDALLATIEKLLPDIRLTGSREHRVANNLNVSVPGLIGERAVLALSAWGVAASTRSACAAKDEELSHVIRTVADTERARTAVRFTLLPTASASDAQTAAKLLAKAATQYREIDRTL